MTIAALLADARARHESLMVDTCTIVRLTPGSMNTTTGAITNSSSTLYSGKCRLRGSTAAGVAIRETDTGEAEQTSHRYALLLPYGSDSTIAVGDVATIGTRTFTIVGRIKASTTTAASLLVEEVEA
jgi:predicted RecA/RadA family phage recombinase